MKKFILLFLSFTVLVGCEFYEVDPGKVYRSNQLDAEQLQGIITSKGIKTIINLRGENHGASWYENEKKVAQQNGVRLINISMSAKNIPHRDNLIKLLDGFRDAERPILIHCKAGVDRTGEASAIYQMLYMGKSRKEAMEMLSARFLYLENKNPAKKYFIKEVWQGEAWARTQYFPCQSQYNYYDIHNPACNSNYE